MPAFGTVRVALGTTAQVLATGASTQSTVVVRNASTTGTVYIGDSTVSATTGLSVPPGGWVEMDLAMNEQVWGVASAAATTVEVMTTFTRAAIDIGIGPAAQTSLGDVLGVSGAVTAPGAGAAIASLTTPPAGVYEVWVVTYQVGTIDTAQPANLRLQKGAGPTVISGLLSTALATQMRFPRVTLDGASNLAVASPAVGAAGSVYCASLTAVRIA